MTWISFYILWMCNFVRSISRVVSFLLPNIHFGCGILILSFNILLKNSDKYGQEEMEFHWRKDHPLTFPNDFGENGFRLPKYVVSFITHDRPYKVNFGERMHWVIIESKTNFSHSKFNFLSFLSTHRSKKKILINKFSSIKNIPNQMEMVIIKEQFLVTVSSVEWDWDFSWAK